MFETIYTLYQYNLRDRVPEIKLISLYNSQLFNESKDRKFNFPAIFIEIPPIQFNNWLNKVQYSTVTVKIHITSEIVTSFDDGDTMLDTSFEHLALLDKVYKELEHTNTFGLPEEGEDGYREISGDFVINSITRKGVDVAKTFGNLKDSIITYEFFMVDKSAVAEEIWVEFTEANDFVLDLDYDKTI